MRGTCGRRARAAAVGRRLRLVRDGCVGAGRPGFDGVCDAVRDGLRARRRDGRLHERRCEGRERSGLVADPEPGGRRARAAVGRGLGREAAARRTLRAVRRRRLHGRHDGVDPAGAVLRRRGRRLDAADADAGRQGDQAAVGLRALSRGGRRRAVPPSSV